MAYHHGELRDALLQAGLELIRERGADGFTLREAARRAGVSHTAPYRHFRDKAELTAAIAEEGFAQLGKSVSKAAAAGSDPLDRLQRGGLAYIEFAMKHADRFRVMFSTQHPTIKATADATFEGLLSLIHAALEAGQLRPADPRTLARMAWAQVHGIAMLAIGEQFAFRSRAEVLAFARDASDALYRGIAHADPAAGGRT